MPRNGCLVEVGPGDLERELLLKLTILIISVEFLASNEVKCQCHPPINCTAAIYVIFKFSKVRDTGVSGNDFWSFGNGNGNGSAHSQTKGNGNEKFNFQLLGTGTEKFHSQFLGTGMEIPFPHFGNGNDTLLFPGMGTGIASQN